MDNSYIDTHIHMRACVTFIYIRRNKQLQSVRSVRRVPGQVSGCTLYQYHISISIPPVCISTTHPLGQATSTHLSVCVENTKDWVTRLMKWYYICNWQSVWVNILHISYLPKCHVLIDEINVVRLTPSVNK